MKTKDLLELDFRKSESEKIMQSALRRVQPLSKLPEGRIPLGKLERLLFLFQVKYEVEVSNMTLSYSEDQPIYCLKSKGVLSDQANHAVYGITLYEVFSKAIVAIWSDIKSGKINKRKDSK